MADRQFARTCFTLNVVAAALGWSYATTFERFTEQWANTPEYSHGWLIPLFSLWWMGTRGGSTGLRWRSVPVIAGVVLMSVGLVLASRPSMIASDIWPVVTAVLICCGMATCLAAWGPIVASSGEIGWGLAAMLLGLALRQASAVYYVDWFDGLSLLPVLGGLSLVVYGRQATWGALPAILFLAFMVPLPFSLETLLRDPLRSIATKTSTYVLQTIGLPTISEGFVIIAGGMRIGVTEACSGLSMLMVFAALTAGVVMLVKRPWWYMGILCLSWPVIAILANVFRIVVTATLHWNGLDQLANVTFHDLAGLAMMPVGLALFGLEMAYLDRLLVLETERRVTPFLMGTTDEPETAPSEAGTLRGT